MRYIEKAIMFFKLLGDNITASQKPLIRHFVERREDVVWWCTQRISTFRASVIAGCKLAK